MVTLAGGLWSLSAALSAWLWFPCPASVGGAVAGCAVATLLATRCSRNTAIVTTLLWAGLALLALLIRQKGLAMPSAEASVLAVAMLASALTAFAVVSTFHRLQSMSLMLLAECALFSLPWVALLSGHRQGHLDQPVALVEQAWAAGFDPFRLFATAGIALGMMLTLLVASRRARRITWKGSLLLGLAAVLCALALPLEKISRMSGELVQSQSSQVSAVAAEKPDAPQAVVVLYQDYEPELGSFHFAAQSDENAAGHSPSVGTTPLHYRVAEIVEQPERLILGWSPEILPATVAGGGQAFARVYEVKSEVVSRPLAELLDLPGLPVAPPHGPFSGLAQEIVPEPERDRPLRAALRVKLWMEQNRSQSLDQPPDSGSVEACLQQKLPVGQKTYTLAAQALLDSLGLSTRLVQGYAVRADQRGEGSFLLLTESNQRCWLELWIEQVGPIVVDMYPLDGPSDSDGPQNQDLQRQLGELARARGKTGQPLPGLSAGAMGFLLFLTIVAAGGYSIKIYRRLRVLWCAPSRLPVWGYALVLDRLAEVEELRAKGETRLEFALRLKDRVPSLEPLTHLHQKSHLGHPGKATYDNARPLMLAALKECSRHYPAYKRWSGWLHPFAWMKVL